MVLCFFGSLARHAAAAWSRAKYQTTYRRARSDYVWRRWRVRAGAGVGGDDDKEEEESMPPVAARRGGRFCCELSSCCCCCPCSKGQFSAWGVVSVFSLIFQFVNLTFYIRSIKGFNLGDPTCKAPPPTSLTSLCSQSNQSLLVSWA
jgi:hypothetical protein